jgi:hypothetical protein
MLTFKLKGFRPLTKRVAFESTQDIKVALEREAAAAVPAPGPAPVRRPPPKKDLADNPFGPESDLKDLPQ